MPAWITVTAPAPAARFACGAGAGSLHSQPTAQVGYSDRGGGDAGVQVALVSQEPVLFAESIFSNIAFGCSEVPSMEQVQWQVPNGCGSNGIGGKHAGVHSRRGSSGQEPSSVLGLPRFLPCFNIYVCALVGGAVLESQLASTAFMLPATASCQIPLAKPDHPGLDLTEVHLTAGACVGRWRQRLGWPTPMTSSLHSPRATTRWLGSGGCGCQADRSSGWPLRELSS